MAKLYGVLVGVDYYPNDKKKLAKTLCCAVNDVERAFEILTLARENTDLILLANRDASLERIRKEVEKIGKKIKTHDDSFLFMFSGHGWATRVNGDTTEEGEATAVFLTENFDGKILPGTIPTGGFTLENLASWLGRKKPPKKILLLFSTHVAQDRQLVAGAILRTSNYLKIPRLLFALWIMNWRRGWMLRL